MEYLDNIGEKVGLGNVDLDNIKRQASYYLRDKFKSARLLLTDVTPSQLLTEEATNDDEWGPATKTMAAITDACRRPDECLRIMQVLHSRLGLIGKKHWRQFLKTLTVVEFLLFHGPEQVVMEFSSDRDLLEDLTRFNYVSERGVDHGLVVRKKAKQVLKLLMEDDYFQEERARAQKLSKSIFGQGSYQSSSTGSGTSRYGGFGNTSPSSASTGLMFDDDPDDYHTDKKFTAFEERILSEKRGNRQEKFKNGNGESTASEWRAFEDDSGTFSPNQNATGSNWADFSNESQERDPKLDDSSPFSGSNELLEGESFSPRSSQAPPPSVSKSNAQNPLATPNVPVSGVKEELNSRGKSKLKVRSYALSNSASGDFKLPPPPPPPGGSKVTIIKSAKSRSAQPDLLDLSFDAPASASDSQEEESLLSFGAPSKVAGSDQAVLDFLGMTSSPVSLPNTEFDFLSNNASGDKVSEPRNPGLPQLVPDLFDLGGHSTRNNSVDLGSLGHQEPANATSFVKDKGSEGGIPDLLNLNHESTATQSERDFFGSGVQPGSTEMSASSALPGGAPNLSVNGSHQNFLSERSSTEAKEVVPDVFDAIAPDFAAFGIKGTERKPVTKPADDLFNLLS